MKQHLIAGLIAITALAPIGIAAPAVAQDRGDYRDNDRNGDGPGNNGRGHAYGHDKDRGYNRDRGRGDNDYRWNGDRNGNWEPSQHYREGNYRARALGRNDHIYRGQDGRAYCRRSDGTTGLVIGALGGGVLGNVVGGGTLGTLFGAGGGALLGRSIDRGNIQCR